MKANDHSSKPTRNENSLYRPASSRSETAVFATLGLVGVLAVLMAVIWGSVPAGSNQDPLADFKKLPPVRYVWSGQLIADARTAAAMIHYYFQSDAPPSTNGVVWPEQRVGVQPINTAAVGSNGVSTGPGSNSNSKRRI